MKRLLLCILVVSSAAVLGGCPVYSTTPDSQNCGPYGCYDCPAGSTPSDGTCIPWSCSSSSDCPSGYTCSASANGSALTCVPVYGGSDASDCSSGCPSGYVCKLAGGQTQCVPASRTTSDAGMSADAANDAAVVEDSGQHIGISDGGPPVGEDAGSSLGTADATDVAQPDAPSASDGSASVDSPTQVACNANSACTAGETCVNGMCTPPSGLCSDTTQCITAGEACVNGICMPHCSASSPCPSGYGCDFNRGVCSLNASPCTGSGAANCQGGSTCVEGRCAAPCASGESSSACPAGQVCVNGGCIPNEAAQFTCKNDGQSGALATSCDSTQICLHHDCYTACDPDAANPCGDASDGCKQVTVFAGTYDVCGSSSTLGSDCDLAAGKACSSGVCIDGYCR